MPVAGAGLVRRLCELVFLSFLSELTETHPYGTHVNWPRRHHTGPDNRRSRTCTSSSLGRSDWGISPYQPRQHDFFPLVTPYRLKNGAHVWDPTLSQHNSKMMMITGDRMTPHTCTRCSPVNGASQAKRGARTVVSVKGINGATSGATSLIRNEMFRHCCFQCGRS